MIDSTLLKIESHNMVADTTMLTRVSNALLMLLGCDPQINGRVYLPWNFGLMKCTKKRSPLRLVSFSIRDPVSSTPGPRVLRRCYRYSTPVLPPSIRRCLSSRWLRDLSPLQGFVLTRCKEIRHYPRCRIGSGTQWSPARNRRGFIKDAIG